MFKTKISSLLIALLFTVNTSVSGQSIKLDKKLGKKNYEEVVKTYGLYNNKEMNNYLNKVGQKLVSQLDSALFEYKFYIVNQPEPNAFALPGGYIFITTGIIPILQTEDELAGIIGHEIIHSNNRHSVRQLRKKILPTILSLPIKVASAITPGSGIITAPITTSENLIFASYSRKFENEADEQGIVLAAKAGYNPLALPKALNRLMKAVEFLTGEKETKSYFADHPYTPDRDKNINKIAKDLKIATSDKISKDFLLEFEGITFGNNPANGVNNKNEFLQLNRNFHIKYPENWILVNNDSVIIGYSKQKDAFLSLKATTSKLSPKEKAEDYIKNLTKKQKKFFVKSEEYKVNDKKGYIVNFEEVFFNDTTYANILWLTIDNKLFEISSMSDIKNSKILNDITKSIRPLSKTEKESIMIKYIKIVKANKGETIIDLCKRTECAIDPKLAAILNSHKDNDKLIDNEEIKIIKKRQYIQK